MLQDLKQMAFSVSQSIRSEVGYDAEVECNMNASNTSQVYQVYLWTVTSGKNLIECLEHCWYSSLHSRDMIWDWKWMLSITQHFDRLDLKQYKFKHNNS